MDYLKLIKIMLFPELCMGCKKLGFTICPACQKKLTKVTIPYCIVCDRLSLGGVTHTYCRSEYTPHQSLSPFKYSQVTKKIIINSKYGQKSFCMLDTLITHPHSLRILQEVSDIDIVVPIPETKSFKNRRLINHSAYIAKKISQIIKKPMIDILHKKLSSKNQKSLSREIRLQNISGLIMLKNTNYSVKGKRILLVDDVITTGATLLEACKILKKHGASAVSCYTLAKDMRYNKKSTRY